MGIVQTCNKVDKSHRIHYINTLAGQNSPPETEPVAHQPRVEDAPLAQKGKSKKQKDKGKEICLIIFGCRL